VARRDPCDGFDLDEALAFDRDVDPERTACRPVAAMLAVRGGWGFDIAVRELETAIIGLTLARSHADLPGAEWESLNAGSLDAREG